jgi:protein SCO1/2
VNLAAAGCEHRSVTGRLAAVVGSVLLATACGSATASSSHQASSASLHGATPTSTQMRPEFDLVDTNGHPYDFQAATQGQVTLLYFGYTHCPDECPTSMADLAAALRAVPATVSQQVRVVFVTTDPWRDTRPVLRHWLDRFHPPEPFIGLTGSPAQIAGAETTMGMPISTREPAPKSYGSGKYAVSHFAAVMVYGRDDRLATLYPSGQSPTDIATDLKVLVEG